MVVAAPYSGEVSRRDVRCATSQLLADPSLLTVSALCVWLARLGWASPPLPRLAAHSELAPLLGSGIVDLGLPKALHSTFEVE